MQLEEVIKKSFPDGMPYDDAAQLCLKLFCDNALPKKLQQQCTKNNLAVIFANLASSQFIQLNSTDTASIYGANSHERSDKGHWIKIIASVFKKETTSDIEQGRRLVKQLTKTLKKSQASIFKLLLTGITVDFILLLISSTIMDGGTSQSIALIAITAHLIASLIILIRRRTLTLTSLSRFHLSRPK